MKLLIYRGDALERTLELAARDFRIGRAAENDIVLEDPEKTVSRFHAELRFEQDAYALIDLNSQNGTWIDGERVRRTALGPGQSAVMGNFRIEIDAAGGAAGAVTPQSDTLSGAMPQTIAMSAESVAGALAVGGAGTPGAAAPAAAAGTGTGAGSAVPGAASAAASGASAGNAGAGGGAPAGAGQSFAPSSAPGYGVKRAPLPADETRRAGSASIPRPMLYGSALVFLLLIVGVMYIFRPQPGPPPDQGPAQEAGGPESNQQIIARLVAEGREKLQAGDAAGAIAAASRALVVDPNQADALDLKTKAEERRRQDEANAAAQQAGGTATGAAGATGGTAAAGQSASTAAAGTGTGATPASGAAAGQGTPASASAATGATKGGSSPATTSAATTSATSTAPAQTASSGTAKPAGASGGATGTATTGAAGTRTAAARRATAERDRDIAKRYAGAKAAMSSGNYTEAAAGFEAIVKERPGYLDAASMLDQSRGHIRTQAQQITQQAAELSAKGEFAAALQQYERARRLDPSLAGAEQGVAAVRRQMKEAGDDAFRRARQLDAVGRAPAALPLYERAASLLSADDANGKTARERIDALKSKTP